METSSIGSGKEGLAGTQTKQLVIHVQVTRVANGYIVGGNYGVEQKIANTLDEALVLVRKEFEN